MPKLNERAADDDETVATALSLNEYGGDDESSWLLLEPVAAPAEAP